MRGLETRLAFAVLYKETGKPLVIRSKEIFGR